MLIEQQLVAAKTRSLFCNVSKNGLPVTNCCSINMCVYCQTARRWACGAAKISPASPCNQLKPKAAANAVLRSGQSSCKCQAQSHALPKPLISFDSFAVECCTQTQMQTVRCNNTNTWPCWQQASSEGVCMCVDLQLSLCLHGQVSRILRLHESQLLLTVLVGLSDAAQSETESAEKLCILRRAHSNVTNIYVEFCFSEALRSTCRQQHLLWCFCLALQSRIHLGFAPLLSCGGSAADKRSGTVCISLKDWGIESMLDLDLSLLFVEVLCTLKVVFLLFKKTILASVAPGEHTQSSQSVLLYKTVCKACGCSRLRPLFVGLAFDCVPQCRRHS